MKRLITIIVPAYNEEEALPSIIKRLGKMAQKEKKYNFEFLFINDGSSDKTIDILKKLSGQDKRISYISFARNFGKEIGVAAGLQHAQGDAVVIMDADGQEPPELIPEMISWWEKGYDDIYARRLQKNDSAIRKMTSGLYYRTVQKMTRVKIQIDTGDFRLFSRRTVDAINQCQEVSRQNKAIFSWVGFKKKEITYKQPPREVGQTKWKFGIMSPGNSLFNLAIDGFTSFSILPLRYISILGVVTNFAAFIYAIIRLVMLLTGTPYNPLDLGFIILLFLMSWQMIAIGIMGEYVGRTFNEVKHRPLYLIDEIHQNKPSEDKADKPGKEAE